MGKTKKTSSRRSSPSLVDELFIKMSTHQTIIKLYHFQTRLYSGHKTSDSYYSKFLELSDQFLEVAQGIYGRISLKHFNISGDTLRDSSIIAYLTKFGKYLETMEAQSITNTDLLNIRDEMLAEVNQFKYLHNIEKK